jgi:DNA-directed RNA polymerase subunit RPC12/RpoP
MELLSTDKAATSLQIGEGGKVYKAKDGVVTVDNPRHASILRQLGCGPRVHQAMGGTAFVCSYCGFRAYFRDQTCPRCGSRDFEEESHA